MKKIDFTVLIPVYNTKAAELIEAVFSISKMNQTIDQDYDILLVDDGSTNMETGHAIAYLRTFIKQVKSIRLPRNGGTSAALNAGHEAIQTEYIALMGSSDISFANRLKMQVEHLQENPAIDALGTNLFSYQDTDPHRKPLATTAHGYTRHVKDPHYGCSYGWLLNHGTVMYKNESVKKAGGYNLDFKRGQDVDLWKRMDAMGMRLHTLSPVLYAWRRNS